MSNQNCPPSASPIYIGRQDLSSGTVTFTMNPGLQGNDVDRYEIYGRVITSASGNYSTSPVVLCLIFNGDTAIRSVYQTLTGTALAAAGAVTLTGSAQYDYVKKVTDVTAGNTDVTAQFETTISSSNYIQQTGTTGLTVGDSLSVQLMPGTTTVQYSNYVSDANYQNYNSAVNNGANQYIEMFNTGIAQSYGDFYANIFPASGTIRTVFSQYGCFNGTWPTNDGTNNWNVSTKRACSHWKNTTDNITSVGLTLLAVTGGKTPASALAAGSYVTLRAYTKYA